MGTMPKILLTGRPGVGKTTVVKNVIKELKEKAGGFYTEEIRKKGKREGFLVRTLEGEHGVLAHVNHRGVHRVGRYGVDVDRFETIVTPCLQDALEKNMVIVIDEIGKMELFSREFRHLVSCVFESDHMVLAVIHQKKDPFTQRIRSWPMVEELTVTEKNRDVLPSIILEKLKI
ncbi:MAG: NTPase [Proteobacteria bacterium]|nr:NTPase [Pseudomonadota bacterium]